MSNNNGTLTVVNPSMHTTISDGTYSISTGGYTAQSTLTYSGGSTITLRIGTAGHIHWVKPEMAAYFNDVMEGQLSQDPDAFATSLNQILKNHPDLLEELQRKLDRDAMTNDLKDLIEGDEEQDTK